MSTKAKKSIQQRKRRQQRVRARVSGTAERPRLAVYRSNTYTYAQLIDDVAGVTLASAHDMKGAQGTKQERAKKVGEELAQKAKQAGITKAVFDRGGFRYMGRVLQVAEGARAQGLEF